MDIVTFTSLAKVTDEVDININDENLYPIKE